MYVMFLQYSLLARTQPSIRCWVPPPTPLTPDEEYWKGRLCDFGKQLARLPQKYRHIIDLELTSFLTRWITFADAGNTDRGIPVDMRVNTHECYLDFTRARYNPQPAPTQQPMAASTGAPPTQHPTVGLQVIGGHNTPLIHPQPSQPPTVQYLMSQPGSSTMSRPPPSSTPLDPSIHLSNMSLPSTSFLMDNIGFGVPTPSAQSTPAHTSNSAPLNTPHK